MKPTPFLVAALLVCAACDELESADDVREAPTPTPSANMDASLDASTSDASALDARAADAGDASLDAGAP